LWLLRKKCERFCSKKLEKLYKTQISEHKANYTARCKKGKGMAWDLRLQTLKRTVSEEKSLFNKC
jgi:hypothetical protein